MTLENKENLIKNILGVESLDNYLNKDYLKYINETLQLTHSLEYEDILILTYFFEKNLNNENTNLFSKFPQNWFASLGYEPFGAYTYIVIENTEGLNVFGDTNDIPQIYKYILFLIEEDQYIAVDGSNDKNTWDYKFI